jgi:serine/threonine protein kinase
MIDQELAKTEKARELLGPVVPTVLTQASLKGQKAVVFEYATGDNRSYEVFQFAEFYRTKPIEQIVNLLRKLFSQVLWPFYQTQLFKSRSASRLYFLPRLDQGEFEKLDEITRRSHLYDPERDGIALTDQLFPNPATILRPIDNDSTCAYHKLFAEKRNAGLCLVHGDVNPRNFLVDGIGNVHIIDFAAMKEEGGRFLDFARLEAEIKFKLTDVEPTREEMFSLVAVERLLVEACDDKGLTMVVHLPFTGKIARMVAAVTALRQAARSICQEVIEDIDFELEYKTALLAQTLRISLYEDYLNQSQEEFAVVSAAILANRLLKLIQQHPQS